MDEFITTSEAARLIGCNDSRVRQLARDKKVVGRRVGRDWLIDRASAQRWADSDRKPGRKPNGRDAEEEGPRDQAPRPG